MPVLACQTWDDPGAAALLGADLPEAAERQLRLAGLAYEEDDLALAHLRHAQRLAPDHAAVLIGLYRFHFYKSHWREALAIAERCLVKAARGIGLADDWRQARPGQADFGSYDAVLARFYLFTLKADAYLQLRLGALAEGAAMVAKLLELDPSDKVGARVLLDVLDRREVADDD